MLPFSSSIFLGTLEMLPFSAQWPVRERHAIPPRKTEAPAAPTFPALVYSANNPCAQDFWDASFFCFLFLQSLATLLSSPHGRNDGYESPAS
jgi:hypothetical protein